MDIQKLLDVKIARLQDLNTEMQKVSNEIGAAQEKGRALHNAALEVKGAIDGLLQLKVEQDKELKSSETAKLILPEGVKPIIPETLVVSANGTVAPATDANTETAPAAKAPTTLEVVK